jgi:tripeptidyl-peptidase I
MLLLHYLLVAAAAVPLSSAVPTAPRHVVHEQKRSQDPTWVKRNRVESSAILPVRIGLTQSNLEQGHDLLMELSHPDSPRYGQWWTAEEVNNKFAPAVETVTSVKDWLVSMGIEAARVAQSDNRAWLAFDASADEAESLFQTEFYEHEHSNTRAVRVGCDK